MLKRCINSRDIVQTCCSLEYCHIVNSITRLLEDSYTTRGLFWPMRWQETWFHNLLNDICHGVTWSRYTGGTWPWLSLRLKLSRRSGFRKTTSPLLHFICNFCSFQLCEVFWSRSVVVICWNRTVSDICFLFSMLGHLRRALRCAAVEDGKQRVSEWSIRSCSRVSKPFGSEPKYSCPLKWRF